MIKRQVVTGTGAINYTFDPGVAFQLEEITLHLSAVGGDVENMTIDVQYKEGAPFAWRVVTQAMAAVQDYQYLPIRPLEYWAGDSVLIQYANTNPQTWGLVIKIKW
jgi:hypothetical protein